MNSTKSLLRSTGLIAGIAVFAALSLAQPTLAQPVDEEIVITAHRGELPDNVQTASQPVSYADLDLSTGAGRDILKHRLRLTSRYLCEKLGETDTSPGVTPSCRDAAYQDALSRAGTVWEHFAPRGTAWVAPPAWHAPYPGDWDRAYP